MLCNNARPTLSHTWFLKGKLNGASRALRSRGPILPLGHGGLCSGCLHIWPRWIRAARVRTRQRLRPTTPRDLGLCVFALVVVRVLWRIVDTQPDPPQVSLWMSVAAKAVQWALYLFLFALPLTAIAGAWLEGHPLTLLAGLEIPSVLEVSHNVGATVATIHTWLVLLCFKVFKNNALFAYLQVICEESDGNLNGTIRRIRVADCANAWARRSCRAVSRLLYGLAVAGQA